MSGWTKLFASIVTSSVWVEPDHVVRVWIAMLATADAEGLVEGSIPGFANLARVTVDEMRAAVVTLSGPDLDSRTTDNEGRRIEAIAGGWRILNHQAYREKAQAKDGSRAPYFRAYRKRKTQQSQHEPQHENVARNTEARGEKQETEQQRQRPAARAAKQQAGEANHGEDIARFETAFRRAFRRPRASLPPHKHAVFAERLKGGYPAEFLIGLPVAAVASGLSKGRDVQPEFLLRNGAGHYSRGGETRSTFDWLGSIWQSADKLTMGPDQAAILSELGILEWWTTRGAAVHSTAADEC